jgi:3-oxoacyl-[acyl-carrier-protein] synthase-3
MPQYAALTGWGHYAPEKVLTNTELELLVGTTDDWIRTRTGICQRRLAAPGETTSSMCLQAARRALRRARLPAQDLDLVICATTTPDQLLPATACLLQERLGATHAGAFDLNSACTGFVNALIVGSQFIQAGTCERVLVVAGETLSRFINWTDRDTCVLFGDGAGAVVLEASAEPCGVVSTVMGCQGDVKHMLAIKAGGSARPAAADTLAAGDHYITMRGNEVFKLAIRAMSKAANQALARAGLSARDVHTVIPHQANLRIIRATQEALGVPAEKVYVNVDRYGNTGAAAVAIALSEFAASPSAQAGDNLLLVAFGGGMTWAAAVVQWADVAALTRGRPAGPFTGPGVTQEPALQETA